MPPHLKLEVIKTMRAAKYMAIRVSKALPVVEEAAALASTMGTAAHDLVVSNPHAPSAILGTLRALDGCAVDAEAAMSRRSGELRGLLEALHEWQPVLSEHLALLETRCYKPNKIGGRTSSPRRSKSPSSKAGGGGFNLGPSSSDKEEEERKMWGIYSQVRMANEVIEEAHGACISGLKEATQRTKRSNVAKGQIQKASIQVKGEREYVRRQELLYYRLSEAMDAHLEEEAEKEGNAPLLPTEPPPPPSPTTLAAKEGVPRPTPVISPDGCVVWPRRGEPYQQGQPHQQEEEVEVVGTSGGEVEVSEEGRELSTAFEEVAVVDEVEIAEDGGDEAALIDELGGGKHLNEAHDGDDGLAEQPKEEPANDEPAAEDEKKAEAPEVEPVE